MNEKTQDTPDSKTFATALGQAVWLMTMTNSHRDLPIHEIEARVAFPILLRQFRLYSKDNQPVAFLTWASVSDDVKERLITGDRILGEKDWRSGTNMMIVDVVSPFNTREVFEKRFLDSLKKGPKP